MGWRHGNVNCYLTFACSNEFCCLQALPHLLSIREFSFVFKRKKAEAEKRKFKLTPLVLFRSSLLSLIQIPIDVNCEHPFMLIFSINFLILHSITFELEFLLKKTEKLCSFNAKICFSLRTLSCSTKFS